MVPFARSSFIAVVPASCTVPLVTTSVPTLLVPGATVAPGLATRLPLIVPLPVSVWPLPSVSVPSVRPVASSVVLLRAMFVVPVIEPEPSSASVPPVTMVRPEKLLGAARYSVPPPDLLRLPVPLMVLLMVREVG